MSTRPSLPLSGSWLLRKDSVSTFVLHDGRFRSSQAPLPIHNRQNLCRIAGSTHARQKGGHGIEFFAAKLSFTVFGVAQGTLITTYRVVDEAELEGWSMSRPRTMHARSFRRHSLGRMGAMWVKASLSGYPVYLLWARTALQGRRDLRVDCDQTLGSLCQTF